MRALHETEHSKNLKIVAINELAGLDIIAHLTKYDSTHGRFSGTIEHRENVLIVNGEPIHVSHHKEIDEINWTNSHVDLVMECSGAFTDRQTALRHIESGAKRVLFSQPADPDVDATIVYGVNDHHLSPNDVIISNASCTTNCIIPVLALLDKTLGIDKGHITTVHSAMNDQPVIDQYHHTDLRRTRSASASIIPVETALARGVSRILPKLEGKITASAMRVPTINVSNMNCVVSVSRDTSTGEVNRIIKEAALTEFSGVMGYTEEQLASCDFNHDPHSAIVDGSQTSVCDKRLVKIMAWFDNEWGFANRMLDVANCLSQI